MITALLLDTDLPTQNALCLLYKGRVGVTGVLMKLSRQIELHLRTRGRGRGRRTLMACPNNVTPAKILLIISSIADGI